VDPDRQSQRPASARRRGTLTPIPGAVGTDNKTYGSLASVIIFLVWLWLSNTAILLGAELNAELERGRAIAAGHPPEEEPYMELRDTSKLRERDNL
jgi:membrane protein